MQPIVQALIKKGRDVTMGQLDQSLPKREFSSTEIEDIMAALSEHGIDLTE
jgi:SOS response regulatory protein OraA/RecX